MKIKIGTSDEAGIMQGVHEGDQTYPFFSSKKQLEPLEGIKMSLSFRIGIKGIQVYILLTLARAKFC